MPAMLATVIAPRTRGFSPNIRPKTAPAKKIKAGATYFPLIIDWYSHCDPWALTPVAKRGSGARINLAA